MTIMEAALIIEFYYSYKFSYNSKILSIFFIDDYWIIIGVLGFKCYFFVHPISIFIVLFLTNVCFNRIASRIVGIVKIMMLC